MRTLAASKCAIRRCGCSSSSLAKWSPAGTAAGLASAPFVMPPGSEFVIPTLDKVPLEYQFSGGDGASITLARTLVELQLAAPEDWAAAKRDPATYVLLTLERWIAAHGGDAISRRFDLYATLADRLDSYLEASEDDASGESADSDDGDG